MSIIENIYHHGFHIIENFLNENDYQALRQRVHHLQQAGEFKPAKIGLAAEKTQNTTVRNDMIFWLDNPNDHPAINHYFAKINSLSKMLNESLFLGLMDCEAHFAIYQPDNFYKKHIDQFSTKKDRRISCVYYLNDHWQDTFGGQLKLYDQNDLPIVTIAPLGNRFVCFDSHIPHEVCTAHQTRYSIAAWLKTRPLMRAR